MCDKDFNENEKRLSQIVQVSPVPTFVIDDTHHITHWNRACENLTGISSREVIGTQDHWRAFYTEKRPVLADLIVDNAPEAEISKYYGDTYRKSEVIEEGCEAEYFFPAL